MKAEGQEQLYKVTVASNKPNTNKKRSIGKQTALKRGRDTIASICQSFDTCVWTKCCAPRAGLGLRDWWELSLIGRRIICTLGRSGNHLVVEISQFLWNCGPSGPGGHLWGPVPASHSRPLSNRCGASGGPLALQIVSQSSPGRRIECRCAELPKPSLRGMRDVLRACPEILQLGKYSSVMLQIVVRKVKVDQKTAVPCITCYTLSSVEAHKCVGPAINTIIPAWPQLGDIK